MILKSDLAISTIAVCAMLLVGCKSIEKVSFTAMGCCPMCETVIINAVSSEEIKSASWHQFDQVLTVEFFKGETTSSELQKKVSLAGFDTDLYLAPDSIYYAMPECCRYRD